MKKHKDAVSYFDSLEIIHKLGGLLARRRRLIPFPVPVQDTYWEMFPLSMQGLLERPPVAPNLLASAEETSRYIRHRNAYHALDLGTSVAVEFPGKPVRAFYMRFEPSVPIPTSSMIRGLAIPPDHPHYRKIEEWQAAADSMDSRHNLILSNVEAFLRSAGNMHALRHVWPELIDVLKLQRNTPDQRPVSPATVAHLNKVLSPKQRQYIIEQLAAAMMLDPYEPVAWCGYGPMGSEK